MRTHSQSKHTHKDTTHICAPALSWFQGELWACPQNPSQRCPISAANRGPARAGTDQPQIEPASPPGYPSIWQISAGLCGTGPHPAPMHYTVHDLSKRVWLDLASLYWITYCWSLGCLHTKYDKRHWLLRLTAWVGKTNILKTVTIFRLQVDLNE